jgi:DNA-binding response OmpR family regulator
MNLCLSRENSQETHQGRRYARAVHQSDLPTVQDGFTPARVAVIEDERGIRDFLESALRQAGFDIRSAADGLAGLKITRGWRPDVIVLDLMLPKVDGLSLLPMIRRESDASVLILSARGDVSDRIEGLARGADDYLPKPFDVDELIIRIRALLRRPSRHVPMGYSFADLRVDLATRTVLRGERIIRLSSREFDLLVTLLRRPRRVFSKDELLERIWGDRDVLRGCVETYIGYLRNKIDAAGEPRLIHTVRGAGYTVREA